MNEILDSIPSLKDWLAAAPQHEEIATERKYARQSSRDDPYHHFKKAILEGDHMAARQIQRKQDWRAHSYPYFEGEDSKSLMFYSCHCNGKLAPMTDYMTFLYLADEEPDAVLATPPGGGSMLHATLCGAPSVAFIKELLVRGVNPYRTDDEGKTFLDHVRKSMENDDASLHNETLKADFARICGITVEELEADMRQTHENSKTMVALLEEFIATHSKEECEAREAEIKARHAPAKTWAPAVQPPRRLTGGGAFPNL